jgi:hypothetical protein
MEMTQSETSYLLTGIIIGMMISLIAVLLSIKLARRDKSKTQNERG